jgi:LmbE family N-acetylglucosaminyl deacetylase
MNFERILVFAAHPDDEISMPGTIRKLADAGVEVHVCVSADGCEGYPFPEWEQTIVAMRRAEQVEVDKVLGVTKRHQIDSPDMAVVNDKATLMKFIRVIREVRPDAVFTHGPSDFHRDHTATSALSLEAVWHAGEPVARALGAPWTTPQVYLYKGAGGQRPHITIDCTGYAHIRPLALATQVSQHVLFETTREEFEARARRQQEERPAYAESFWLTDRMVLREFPAVVRG